MLNQDLKESCDSSGPEYRQPLNREGETFVHSMCFKVF